MNFKYYFNTIMLVLTITALHAQDPQSEDPVNSDEDIIIEIEETDAIIQDEEDYNDTWRTARISDEMTKDPDQNKEWRMGQNKFSSKPKNALEIGIHAGHFFIDGDVDREIPGGFGVGLHLRKAVHYLFSLKGELFYGVTKGLDPQPSGGNLLPEGNAGGVFNGYGPENPWFFSYKTRYIYGTLEGVLNVGNLLFHKERNKWNLYATIGAGLDTHETMLDLRDENGDLYTDLVDRVNFSRTKVNTLSGRNDIKRDLRTIYDGNYETEGFKKTGIFRIGDETNIHVMWTASVGVARKISKRFNLGIEHKLLLSDNDFLDGQKYRTNLDQTNNVDIGHYTNVRMAFNLGNFDKRTEPLYWLNPVDNALQDIASLKQRPELDLSDEDSDGVIDMLDQELDTEEGCPVDTRGITLDSDGDGLVDCKDMEPYSPPGCPINEYGVAECDEDCCMDEEEVKRIAQESMTESMSDMKTEIRTEVVREIVKGPGGQTIVTEGGNFVSSGCGNWFLPMIHYDLDKSSIKKEYYPQLHHVATVMKKCPNICVVAHGHTDSRNSNAYNNVLSYNRAKSAIDYLVSKYGIDRSRFKLMYGGEESPLGQNATHYLNRRVEFKTCDGNSYDMPLPEGANSSTKGSGGEVIRDNFNGNKNSGY